MKKRILTAAMLGILLGVGQAANGQASYPTKPVRILVGFPAGQTTDLVARRLAQGLSRTLGQPFVVENRPGSGGSIAAELVARSTPDGYTLLLSSSGPLAINGALYSSLRYNAEKDFTPVAALGWTPQLLLVPAQSPYRTLADFVAAAKSKPGTLNYASGGNGVSNHLIMELFKQRAGLDMRHVPYKGSVPALADLVAGRVDAMFDGPAVAQPFIKDGRLRALAVSGETRMEQFPEVQTVREAGYPGFKALPWSGVVAPAGTPQPILDKLHAEISRTTESVEWQERLRIEGGERLVMSRNEFGAFIHAESERWSEVVRKSGARID
ncbi:MAG: Bug family tripartite tricarboxylate transporter substrate binding protein [Cupriavidus necator]